MDSRFALRHTQRQLKPRIPHRFRERRNACVLRRKLDTDSGGSWTPISAKLDTDFGPSWTPISVKLDSHRLPKWQESPWRDAGRSTRIGHQEWRWPYASEENVHAKDQKYVTTTSPRALCQGDRTRPRSEPDDGRGVPPSGESRGALVASRGGSRRRRAGEAAFLLLEIGRASCRERV